jgi:hypothetical protein
LRIRIPSKEDAADVIFNVVYRSTNACDQIQIGGIDEPPTELERGGRGGIRTHGTLAGTPVFKTGALNHSATLPVQ